MDIFLQIPSGPRAEHCLVFYGKQQKTRNLPAASMYLHTWSSDYTETIEGKLNNEGDPNRYRRKMQSSGCTALA